MSGEITMITEHLMSKLTDQILEDPEFYQYSPNVIRKAARATFFDRLKYMVITYKIEKGFETKEFEGLMESLKKYCVNYTLVERGIVESVKVDGGKEVLVPKQWQNKPDDRNIH